MNRLLHFILNFGKIMVSRQEAMAGVVACENFWRRHLSAGVPTALLFPEVSNYHPLALAERCFYFLFATYHETATHKTPASGLTDLGRGTMSLEDTMQNHNTSDPRRRKALDYLIRIKNHCDSPLSPLHDTWTKIGATPDGNIWEVTIKDFRYVNALCKAVYRCGGVCYVPRVEYAAFSGETHSEHHAVFVFRFCLNLE